MTIYKVIIKIKVGVKFQVTLYRYKYRLCSLYNALHIIHLPTFSKALQCAKLLIIKNKI